VSVRFADDAIQYPGIIIPVGKANKTIDTEDKATHDPDRGFQCKSMSTLMLQVYVLYSLTRTLDNAEDVHGAPTSIQLVARCYQDEELVAAARLIDECLRSS
jgi:amidase